MDGRTDNMYELITSGRMDQQYMKNAILTINCKYYDKNWKYHRRKVHHVVGFINLTISGSSTFPYDCMEVAIAHFFVSLHLIHFLLYHPLLQPLSLAPNHSNTLERLFFLLRWKFSSDESYKGRSSFAILRGVDVNERTVTMHYYSFHTI